MGETGRERYSDTMTESTYNRDDNVKHLELIQAIIARLATNSFFVKSWTVTLSATLFGFAVNSKSWQISAISLFVVPAFWYLDTYFLWSERLYRKYYEDIAAHWRFRPRFSMDVSAYRHVLNIWSIAFSQTLAMFYLAILIVAIGITVVLLIWH